MSNQIIWGAWAYIGGEFVQDAGVYVNGEMIVETGTAADLTQKYPDADVIGGADTFVLPGLINSHDHGRALGTVSLGAPDSFLEVWLNYLGTIPRLPPRLAATFEGLQLIHAGVTATAHSHNPQSFEVMFDEVPETLLGYRSAGVRVGMHPPFLDQNRLIYDDREGFLNALPPDLRDSARAAMQSSSMTVDDYFTGLDALFASHHDTNTHWTHIQVSPVGGQWASDDFTVRCAGWAKSNQTRMQMHMLETRYQRQYAYRKWGKGFIEHLDDIGALGDWLTLAHMVWVEDTDAALLAERGACVAHNASSNLRLRSGIAPIAKFLDAGVTVGVGLDGHGLDDDQDYLREMRLAFTLANQSGAGSLDVKASTLFKMATQNGACMTFGADAPMGALAAGKLADVVLVDWDAVKGAWCPPNFPADWHVPEFFLRRATRHHVRDVMVHGEWYLRDGKHIQLDEDAVNQEVQEVLASQSPPQLDILAEYVRQHYAAWDR